MSKNRSKQYDERWFIDRMKETFHVSVYKNNVSYEAYLFYHDDIDDSLIPVEHLSKLLNRLLLQTYQHIDLFHNDWIAGIVIEEDTRELLYGMSTLNCTYFLRKVIDSMNVIFKFLVPDLQIFLCT